MKYIKIKIKSLLLIVILLFGIFFFRNNIQLLGIKGIALFNPELSNTLLISMNTLETENTRLCSIIEDRDFKIYNPVTISQGSSKSGASIASADALKIYTTYKAFEKKNPEHRLLNEYRKNVSLMLWFAGLSDEAFEVITSIPQKNLTAELSDQVHLIKAGYNLSFARYDLALGDLNLVSSAKYLDLKDAINHSVNHLMHPDDPLNDETPNFSGKLYNQFFSMLEQYNETEPYAKVANGNTIKGYVRDNGTPLAGVVVYIDEHPGISSYGDFTNFTITDKNGFYEINGFSDEEVGLSLQIPWHRILNKQRKGSFENKPYEFSEKEKIQIANIDFYDAIKFKSLELVNGTLEYEIEDSNASDGTYYSIVVRSADSTDVNGSYSRQDLNQLKGAIPLDSIKEEMEPKFAHIGHPDDLELENLIEPLYLTGDYIFTLSPHEKEADTYISNGYFTDQLGSTLHIIGEDAYSEGDLLLGDKKFVEALTWFESNESIHSYKVLSAIYYRGYIENPEKEYEYIRGGQDLDKSIYYTEKLLATLKNQTYTLNQLTYLYRKNGDYDKEYATLLKLRTLDTSRYIELDIAKNLINKGSLVKGIEHYLKHATEDLDYDRYFGYILLADRTDLLPDSYKERLNTLDMDSMKPFFSLMLEGSYEDAYLWLEDQSQSDFTTFYKLIFRDDFYTIVQSVSDESYEKRDFIDIYTEATENISNAKLQWVLKELKKDSNWFF